MIEFHRAQRGPAERLPRLYHTPSSYYSTIARLALAEAGIAYEPVFVDIHVRRGQQAPGYVRLNPHMSVPTLVLPARILTDSRDILTWALPAQDRETGDETAGWLDLHYGFPIDELTFGSLLARSALARALIPRRLATTERDLRRAADAHPDLAAAYRARAAVFAERVRCFAPATATTLAATRRAEALVLLDGLEERFADGAEVIVPPAFGAADVAWTVFLARMSFVGLGAEIAARPALARYWVATQARPAFAAADVWTRMHLARLVRGVLRG